MATLPEQPDALLVDDNPQVLMAMAMLLEAMGWNTTKANNSEQALTQLRERDFMLAIIDLRMPDTNGIELCRLIRKLDLKKAPTIFLHSGYVDAKSHAEAEKAGARAILQKPISMDEMKKALIKVGLPCK